MTPKKGGGLRSGLLGTMSRRYVNRNYLVSSKDAAKAPSFVNSPPFRSRHQAPGPGGNVTVRASLLRDMKHMTGHPPLSLA